VKTRWSRSALSDTDTLLNVGIPRRRPHLIPDGRAEWRAIRAARDRIDNWLTAGSKPPRSSAPAPDRESGIAWGWEASIGARPTEVQIWQWNCVLTSEGLSMGRGTDPDMFTYKSRKQLEAIETARFRDSAIGGRHVSAASEQWRFFPQDIMWQVSNLPENKTATLNGLQAVSGTEATVFCEIGEGEIFCAHLPTTKL
jgi:hypothetical protein